MGRGKSRLRQANITRAIKAARAAGLEIDRIELSADGTIKIVPGADSPGNEWDDVLRGDTPEQLAGALRNPSK